jgi:hypothetical protein
MISLTKGQAITVSAPAGLVFIAHNQGQIVPAETLSFRILRIATPDEEQAGGVQVFPDPSGLHNVDLVADAIDFDGNAQNGPGGYYIAKWTVPGDAKVGKYAIEWVYKLIVPPSTTFTSIETEPPPQGTIRKFFEVLNTSVKMPGPQYCLVSDAREELGCTPETVTDVRLHRLILLASRMIERVTGRFFDARQQVHRYNGNSSRKLLLNLPVVAVSSIGIDTQPTQAGDLSVDLDMLRIYNRHLSQGMIDPDDRNNPKVEFVHSDDLYGVRFIPFRGISLRSLAWPIGVQNVHVRGFFGYTDPDESPWGDTPLLIQHVCRLIVARELPKIGDRDAREDAQWRWRVTSDSAKDISVDLADPRKGWGDFFGDPEIDSILASFVRPPAMGSV